jgi:hypothetical protein
MTASQHQGIGSQRRLKETITQACKMLNEDKTIQDKKLYFDLISERSDNFKEMLTLAAMKKKPLLPKGSYFATEKVCTEHHITAISGNNS